MLMDINSLKWSSDLCQFFGIDMNSLPEIKSSSDIYGYVSYSGRYIILALDWVVVQKITYKGPTILISGTLSVQKG